MTETGVGTDTGLRVRGIGYTLEIGAIVSDNKLGAPSGASRYERTSRSLFRRQWGAAKPRTAKNGGTAGHTAAAAQDAAGDGTAGVGARQRACVDRGVVSAGDRSRA